MVGTGYIPDRGDIVWLNFNPQAGHEQAGHRPALVLSPAAYNRQTGLGLFCPITSSVNGYPFEVILPPGGPVTGVVIADQIKSLDWQVRGANFAQRTTPQVIGEVMAKVNSLLK